MSRLIYLLSPLKKEGTFSLPMITFRLVANEIEFLDCDTLMFTSKQAVTSADAIDQSWKKYPTIAIGKATKKRVEDLGGKVIYAPNEFYAETLSKDIVEKFAKKKLLYLRPREVSFDSKAYLEKNGVTLAEQVIYETSCLNYATQDKPKNNSIIIFTSPSTINCFFKNFEWHSSYTAVLIGKATQKHLPKGCGFVVADEPLIEACVKKAEELMKN